MNNLYRDFVIMYLAKLKQNKDTTLSKTLSKFNERQKEAAIINIYKYIVTDILQISPYEAAKSIDMDTFKKLQFDKFLEFVNFPAGLPDEYKAAYLTHRAFPKVGFNTDWIIEVYLKALYSNKKITSKFFNDDLGEKKAYLCFLAAIKEFLPDLSQRELYEYFADKTNADNFIKNAMLSLACRNKFGDDPLLYLHYALGEQQNIILYEAYAYMNNYNSKINS